MRLRIFLLLAVSLISCNNLITQDPPPEPQSIGGTGLDAIDSATVQNMFQYYYDLYSVDSSESYLDSIFIKWQNAFTPDEDSCSLTDNEKELIDIYRAAYQPIGFPEEVRSEWGDLYKGVGYLVVDCNFRYAIVSYDPTIDSTFWYGITDSSLLVIADTIPRIRPELSLTKPYCYLDDSFNTGIHAFLGEQYAGLMTSFVTGTEETARRTAFLSKKIRMMHNHWGSGFTIASHPKITNIIMNDDKTGAIIYFTLIYQGGYMIAKKINGTWQITIANITWIT